MTRTLTPRQTEVLKRVASGDQYKMIAHDLGVTLSVIKRYMARIRKRLKILPLALLVQYALAHGLVKNSYQKESVK